MNKKCLFAITNLLLVGIVGLLVGLFCPNIFSTGVGISGFVLLLVALCIPSVIYFIAAKAGYPVVAMFTILMAAEVAANIAFMVKPQTAGKVVAIVQCCIVGLFLISMLAFIAVSNKKEE